MERLQINEGMLWAARYQLVKRLGRGSFASVWLAYDTEAEVEVALKIFAPDTGMEDEDLDNFRDEYRLMFNLNHTNILHINHYDVQDNRPYIVLPFCSNGSAQKLIGRATEEQTWDFLEQVASGLHYLHGQSNRIIHQDIKPANILINSEGRYLISDFGISLRMHKTIVRTMKTSEGFDYERASEKEKLKAVSGTLAYMGPERFTEKPQVVKASDIWSLGASAYELLEGEPPFGEYGGDSQIDIQADQPGLVGKVPAIKAPVSDELKNLIYSCLEETIWPRPTAQRIVEICQARRSVKDAPPPPKPPKPIVWIALAAIALVLVSAVLLIWTMMSEESTDNRQQYATLCAAGDSIVNDLKQGVFNDQELVKVTDVNLKLERAREKYAEALAVNTGEETSTADVNLRMERMDVITDSCRKMTHYADTIAILYNEGRVATADDFKEMQQGLSNNIKKLISNL